MSIIRQDPYLPDGVSQKMIDEAYGVPSTDEEKVIEAATDEYERVTAIMRGLKGKLDAYVEGARKLQQAYIDAHNALESTPFPAMEQWVDAMKMEIEARALQQEDPDAAYVCAMDELPALDRVIEDARIDARERAAEERAEAADRRRERDA